jgi:hypothetical protein
VRFLDGRQQEDSGRCAEAAASQLVDQLLGPQQRCQMGRAMVAARVSREVGERERRGCGIGGAPSLSVRPWPERGRSCPVPGVAWRAATAVLSTVGRKEMRREKTILPLVGMRNHGGSHRAVLFVSMITDSHVPLVSDLRVPGKAGPRISDWAGTTRRAMEGKKNRRLGPREQFRNPIGRPGSHDRENERRTRGHIIRTDGQDIHCVDGPGFTLQCYF